jgi:hypothetical protein
MRVTNGWAVSAVALPDREEINRISGYRFADCPIGKGRLFMKGKSVLAVIFALSFALPVFVLPVHAGNKKHGQRIMIEKMEAVPCGAHEHGVAGLGSLWASVGITSVNSDEKLCPQYLLRTDDMEYHIRPLDHKHPRLLPIGKEGEFKVTKDVIEMSIPDGDRKTRRYQVVAMSQINHNNAAEMSGSPMKDDRPLTGANDKPLAYTPTSPTKPN